MLFYRPKTLFCNTIRRPLTVCYKNSTILGKVIISKNDYLFTMVNSMFTHFTQRRGNDYFIGWARIKAPRSRLRRRREGGEWGGGPPLQPTRESGWGSVVSSPSGVRGSPKTVLVHFQLEKTSDGNKFGIFFVYYWYVKVPVVWCWGHCSCLPSGYATGWTNRTKAEHFIITMAVERVNA